MFNCERCGSSFSPERAASIGNCPRCRARDGVAAPLSFKIFEPAAGARKEESTASVSPRPLSDAVPKASF